MKVYIFCENLLTVRDFANGTEFGCGIELVRLTVQNSANGTERLQCGIYSDNDTVVRTGTV